MCWLFRRGRSNDALDEDEPVGIDGQDSIARPFRCQSPIEIGLPQPQQAGLCGSLCRSAPMTMGLFL